MLVVDCAFISSSFDAESVELFGVVVISFSKFSYLSNEPYVEVSSYLAVVSLAGSFLTSLVSSRAASFPYLFWLF